MKFNLALIAAIATSSVLISPAFAYTCANDHRLDTPAASVSGASISDCGLCVVDHCQVATSFDKTKACVAQSTFASNLVCDANTGLAKCKDAHYEIDSTASPLGCKKNAKLEAAEKECDNAKQSLGYKLDVTGTDPVCKCEYGVDAKTNLCACPDPDKNVRDTNGNCAPRPVIDCAVLKRAAGNGVVYSPENCGACVNATDCINADTFACEAPLENGACDAATKHHKCNDGFEMKNGKCDKKVTDSKDLPPQDDESKKERTPEQKCTDKKRVMKDGKCDACKDGHSSLSDDGVCFPHVTEDACKKEAEKTFRHFDSAKKLCVCNDRKQPEKEEEGSSLTAVCKNNAAKLVVSSVVLLSSVAATALFFL